MDQSQAPLYDCLKQYSLEKKGRHHVPGHRGGDRYGQQATIFDDILRIDFTEISGLDNLHAAEGIIRDAEVLASDCFGSEETFFLVGGSTAGNIASILTLCAPGDKLLVQRDVHQSIIHGLQLARAQAIFLTPKQDFRSGLAAGLELLDLERALKAYPDVQGVVFTNPSYFGVASDITALINKAHSAGKAVIVDEAHGAHFGFHEQLPPSALQMGADIVVQSTHKMLTAMTMGSMLHVQHGRVNRGLLQEVLRMVQSSSPSYPIMASLDLARRLIYEQGHTLLECAMHALAVFRKQLKDSLPWFLEIGGPPVPVEFPVLCDPFKLLLCDATGTLSGAELKNALEDRGHMIELNDAQSVLLVFSLVVTEAELNELLAVLKEISEKFQLMRKWISRAASNDEDNVRAGVPWPSAHHIGLPVSFQIPHQPLTVNVETIFLNSAEGRLAAERVIPYPPGIPVLYPGERITIEMIDYLNELVTARVEIHGTASPDLTTIRVYCHTEEG